MFEKSQTSSSSSPTTKKTTLVGKYNKKMKFQHVGRTMSKKLSMSKSSKDSLDTFAKVFCFSMVHVRINKCISNPYIIENYQKAIEGI